MKHIQKDTYFKKNKIKKNTHQLDPVQVNEEHQRENSGFQKLSAVQWHSWSVHLKDTLQHDLHYVHLQFRHQRTFNY